MALSAALTAWAREWAAGGNMRAVIVTFAIGGVLALVPALVLFNLAKARKSFSQRFAIAFLLLSAATLGSTLLVYSIGYRSYYAKWHAVALTHDWFLQLFFTTASGVYQFAVLGVRSFLPLGLVCLFGVSWLIARRPV